MNLSKVKRKRLHMRRMLEDTKTRILITGTTLIVSCDKPVQLQMNITLDRIVAAMDELDSAYSNLFDIYERECKTPKQE